MLVRRKYIKSVVQNLILSHNIQPSTPVDVKKIANSLGIKIVLEPTEEELSGFLLRDSKNQNAIIGVNKNHPITRRRFTIAHELGHYLLHNYEGFHFDGKMQGFQVRKRDSISSSGSDLEEREANLFAAELLMPEDFIHQELADIETIDLFDFTKVKILDEMAARYKVSTQALIYRLTNLGYIH